MEINASTTGGQAADALLGDLVGSGEKPAPQVPADERAAIQAAVGALLSQAGIDVVDPVEVHFAASPEGGWAVLRVAIVRGA